MQMGRCPCGSVAALLHTLPIHTSHHPHLEDIVGDSNTLLVRERAECWDNWDTWNCSALLLLLLDSSPQDMPSCMNHEINSKAIEQVVSDDMMRGFCLHA
jgi:hypothetical protein